VRILGITETCDLASLYMRLLAEGHEVRISVSWPEAEGTMAGIVPRTEDWRAELAWIAEAGKDGVLVFEATGFGELQDDLRAQGFNVIGGSAFGDKLEIDRGFAQVLLGEIGLNIAPYGEFETAADALADLERRPRRTVFKLSASAGETFPGVFDDGRDVKALLSARVDVGGRFILMDFVEGIETGVGAYFNGERFLAPACVDWEHKRFFAGDMGELTGEMGTVATFLGSNALFDACLRPLEPLLREAGHVGYININTVINEAGIWPLEFTCRFGYPGFAVLEPLQAEGWGATFARMLARDTTTLPTNPGFAVCVVLSTPPFPHSRREIDYPVGLPVEASEIDEAHLHWGEVGRTGDHMVTAGLYGWTAVVTGVGMGVEEARGAAYARAKRVKAPNLRYRLDIGERAIAGELQQLVEWGWFLA
jgi:phosphoribosylamine--glycine ligase